MAVENFAASLRKVLVHEGGYVNHPADPGGETNKGVTKKVYDAWRKARNLPVRSVKEITDDEVALIYRKNYWDVVHGDELPAGLDYAVFDAGVNSGPARGIKWLQQAVGATPDGAWGPKTKAAVRSASPDLAINALCDRRLAFLKRLGTWGTFGKGWERRVAGVRRDALKMVTAAPEPPAEPLRPIPEATTVTHRDVKRTGGQGLLLLILAALGGLVSKLFGMW